MMEISDDVRFYADNFKQLEKMAEETDHFIDFAKERLASIVELLLNSEDDAPRASFRYKPIQSLDNLPRLGAYIGSATFKSELQEINCRLLLGVYNFGIRLRLSTIRGKRDVKKRISLLQEMGIQHIEVEDETHDSTTILELPLDSKDEDVVSKVNSIMKQVDLYYKSLS